MSLHGDIKVNHHVIGTWSAQNAGPTMDAGIYRCHVIYTDIRGYTKERRFFIKHNYGDGALVLGAKVMLEYDKRRDWPVQTEEHAWLDFCDMHNYHPDVALGSHIKLKE